MRGCWARARLAASRPPRYSAAAAASFTRARRARPPTKRSLWPSLLTARACARAPALLNVVAPRLDLPHIALLAAAAAAAPSLRLLEPPLGSLACSLARRPRWQRRRSTSLARSSRPGVSPSSSSSSSPPICRRRRSARSLLCSHSLARSPSPPPSLPTPPSPAPPSPPPPLPPPLAVVVVVDDGGGVSLDRSSRATVPSCARTLAALDRHQPPLHAQRDVRFGAHVVRRVVALSHTCAWASGRTYGNRLGAGRTPHCCAMPSANRRVLQSLSVYSRMRAALFAFVISALTRSHP